MKFTLWSICSIWQKVTYLTAFYQAAQAHANENGNGTKSIEQTAHVMQGIHFQWHREDAFLCRSLS